MKLGASFQFDGPVGVVEELFPASVAVVAEVNVDEGIAPGLDGFFDKFHAGFLRHSAAFLDVTRGASANNVPPGGLTALHSRDHVVEG